MRAAGGVALLLLFASFGVLLTGGALAVLFGRETRKASVAGAGSAVAGSALGLALALWSLASGTTERFQMEWGFPNNTLSLQIDALSAFFLTAIFAVSALAALFGGPYLSHHAGHRPAGAAWFHFNALVVSMAVVAVAHNGIVFLIGWEAMALSSFFLVMFDGKDENVRRAGWVYLVATHLGTAFVLAFFAVLAARAGSLDFDRLGTLGPLAPATASLLFVLAIVGFGTKAGFVPLHVWLPEAHPAAPSHVSALMSGAMIKLGIYGLLRALSLLGPPEVWWGWLLIAVGVSSGVLGVLYALAQHDLKRLLAYHSVENIGIIALGLGVGVLGLSSGAGALVFLGFGGALLHVLNHAVFKSLLFLGAGAVQAAAHTLELDRLGGLMRRMPRTGVSFLTGSAAIAGLPPLNGFVSEFLIFSGAFLGAVSLPPAFSIPLAAAAGALALIGALACACFVKATGIVFLGQARSAGARSAREVSPAMQAAQLAGAGACIALGFAGPLLVFALVGPVQAASAIAANDAYAAAASAAGPLLSVSVLGGILVGLALALAGLRRVLLRGRVVESGPTWDCGYGQPTPRMQYTASSFAAPVTEYFRGALRTHVSSKGPDGPFPKSAFLHTETPDPFLAGAFTPAFRAARRAFGRSLALQNGRVQFYVLYLVVALVALLLWELW